MAELNIVTITPGTEQYPRNDSASVIELANGDLYVTWMEFVKSGLAVQTRDEAPNRISSLRSSDGGQSWDRHRVEVEPPEEAVNVYDPSLIRLQNDEILFSYFYYTQLEWGKPFLSVGFQQWSDDECETYHRKEQTWEPQSRHSASNTMLRLKNGRIVWATGTTDVWGGPEDNHRCGCVYSDDEGESWQQSKNFVRLPLRGGAEGHIAEAADGTLLMAMRSQMGAVFVTESRDQGVTWSQAQTTGLKSPESMPVLATIPTTGDLVMIWNDSPYLYYPKFGHFGRRTPLSTAISTDCGRSWKNIKNIEDAPDGAFSNPSINFFDGNKAVVTYYAGTPIPGQGQTCDRVSLKAAIVDHDWFYD